MWRRSNKPRKYFNIKLQTHMFAKVKNKTKPKKIKAAYHTILSNKRIRISTETNKPIPMKRQTNQNGSSMKSKRNRRRPF
jgi:hypothetical protein